MMFGVNESQGPTVRSPSPGSSSPACLNFAEDAPGSGSPRKFSDSLPSGHLSRLDFWRHIRRSTRMGKFTVARALGEMVHARWDHAGHSLIAIGRRLLGVAPRAALSNVVNARPKSVDSFLTGLMDI